MRKVMLDTNVVVDYLLGREPGCSDCARLLAMHAACEAAACVSALTLKDAYYLVSMQLKRMERQASGDLSESMARAANEVAWACIRQLVENIIILPTGRAESLYALVLRPLHDDFEDDLVASTARSANVDFLVSNDEQLIRHSPVACLTSSDAVALLESERAGLGEKDG
ncbi:MAG: PIN domain-containing protein [Eggerthellaceae bacterium]|nr:PIN domain-containing protein [Eggerthellaceae bacterium]